MDTTNLTQDQKELMLWGSALYVLDNIPKSKTEQFKEILEEGSYDKFITFLKQLDPKLEKNIADYIKELLA